MDNANFEKQIADISARWQHEFKADLFEGIEEFDKKEFFNVLLNEWFPIWIENTIDEDLKNTYFNFFHELKEIYENNSF